MLKPAALAILVLSLRTRLEQESAAEKPPAVPAILVLSVRGGSGQESISRALITLSTVEVILISLDFNCRKTDTK